MTNLELILQAVEIVENNLKSDLNVADLAKQVGYSLYHFIRLFQGVTGSTPKEYINQRKLTEAAKEILISTGKISDLAFDYHFNDYETFSRAFKRMFDITPTECRNHSIGKEVKFYPRFSGNFSAKPGKHRMSHPEFVEKDSFLLIGLSQSVKSAWMIADLWAQFISEVSGISERQRPERYYQLAYWPSTREMEGFYIMPAVEVYRLTDIPSILVGKTIPKNRYLRFIHRGLPRKIAQTYQWIYDSYLPFSEYRLTFPYNFEFCGPGYKGIDDESSETEIYIPVESEDSPLTGILP